MILATDLDKTMIYPTKYLNHVEIQNATLVDIVDNKPIAYMSNKAIEAFYQLSKSAKIIPVTTRDIDEFKRLKIFDTSEFAITTNGGIILKNGQIFEEWEEHISKLLENVKEDFNKIIKDLSETDFVLSELSIKNGKYIFFKTSNVEKCQEYLSRTLNANNWNYIIQNIKVYILPKEITKERALHFLKQKLNEKIIVAAGDSLMDRGMLEYADYSIIPKHGELYKKQILKSPKIRFVKEGIEAATDILNICLSEVMCKEKI